VKGKFPLSRENINAEWAVNFMKVNKTFTLRSANIPLNDTNDYGNNDICVTVCVDAILVPLYWSSTD
jgi:hypothetical protein